MTQNIGGIKVYSQNRQKKYMKRDSRISGNYSGNIQAMSKKHRNQELEGKALNSTQHAGNIRTNSKSKKAGASYETTYVGNIRSMSKKTRNQVLQWRSLNSTQYEGNIKTNPKAKKPLERSST